MFLCKYVSRLRPLAQGARAASPRKPFILWCRKCASRIFDTTTHGVCCVNPALRAGFTQHTPGFAQRSRANDFMCGVGPALRAGPTPHMKSGERRRRKQAGEMGMMQPPHVSLWLRGAEQPGKRKTRLLPSFDEEYWNSHNP